VRRIVTGHDDIGQSVIASDEEVAGHQLQRNADSTFFQVWATHEMPVALTDEAMMRQREGSSSIALETGSGSVLRLGVLGAGTSSPMHRTKSLDYGVCLEGECEMELDGGQVVTVRAGDVVVQRGTNHAWHNRSTKPCRFAWILLDAEPTTAG
jgi:quercetin dioxygenase-like cupin family protein